MKKKQVPFNDLEFSIKSEGGGLCVCGRVGERNEVTLKDNT